MKQNMNTFDRVIRYVLAILFFILYISGVVAGIFGIILFALGGILIVTSLISFCPLYTLFGRRTLKAHGH